MGRVRGWSLYWWMEKTDRGFTEVIPVGWRMTPPTCYRSGIGVMMHGPGCTCDE